MALSQLQCLDDNHINPRVHESKPEFLYCEDQRLALEALLHDGREAFFKYLEARGLRGFLSDPELETLVGTMEPYDPDSELFAESAEDDEPPLSQHYWPELSDTSIPQMDLGWPDTDSYRGVTRTTMYSQPPMDGQAHIKEVVRKMIAQAQKVIAVVMDVFTDVDIFRDLLDAGFKRRISVYILVEYATLPHFLSMCHRANMHAGHLKHLRVRCTEGVEFYTRSSTKVRGRMGHRFMFIDGDKAVSGSYSFTWMSSRLEKNLVTVVTGQAVDAFDKLFRTLYGTSRSVDLRQVAKEPEPEPEPLPQPASVPPPSAAVARKLYNPKYALALGNPSTSPTPTPSAEHNSPKKTQSQENSENPEVPETKNRRRRKASKEALREDPPIHPGLINLEKACLMSYLPTWPEPDPPSDVIGFINIRDANKPIQVHLQRSEMYGTSQAIKFSSPFSKPKETLPEVAMPRQPTAKHEEMHKPQPAQVKTKENEDKAQPTQVRAPSGDIKSKAEAPERNSPAPGQKCDKDTAKTLNTKDKLHSNTPTNQDIPHLNACTPPQSSRKESSPDTGRTSHMTQAVTTNNPKPNPLPESNAEKEASLNRKVAVVFRTDRLESNSTQISHVHGSTDSNTGQHPQTKMMLPDIGSHTKAVHTQPQKSFQITPNIQTPTVNNHTSPSSTSQSTSSTSLSENNQVPTTTRMTTSTCAPLSTSSSSPTVNPVLPSSLASSSSTLSLPIPKPRTIQLVIKDTVSSDSQKLPELNPFRRPETSTRPPDVHNQPDVTTVVQTLPEREPETVTELQKNSGSKTQKDSENTGNIREAPQQKQRGTVQETKNEEVVGVHDDRAGMQLDVGTNLEARSDVLISDAPKAESVSIQEIIPKDDEPLTSKDCKLTPQTDCVATVQAGTKAPERVLTSSEITEVPNEHCKNVTQHGAYRTSAHELQTISYYSLTPQDIDVSDAEDSVKAPTNPPVAATHTFKDSAGDGTHTSAADTHVKQASPNTAEHNTHSNFQEQVPKARGNTHTPEKSSLRLLLSDTHTPHLLSPTPERESRSLTALVRTPTPDGFLPRTPTPDSQIHTPDSRSYTPDFRTPSDGYVSPRPDSALSTTSEEYYECSDSSFHEPVLNRAAYHNHGETEDHVSFTHTNTPNAATVVTSPASINDNTCATTLGTTDRNTSSSEKQSLSGPAGVSSSSLLEKNMRKEEETANEENGREVDEKGRKLSVAERRTEGDSQETERRGSEEAKRRADHFIQGKDLAETVEKNKEAQPQAPKRKRVLNQSAAETSVDGGVTPGELTNEGAEPKRLSTGDLKPKKVSSEGDRPDKEKAVEAASLGPGSVERRGRPKSTTETEGQKLLHTPPRTPRGQQQGSGSSSPSRPSRPPRPLSASQPLGPRPSIHQQHNHPESKALHGGFQALDNTSFPRRPPSRPPPPVTTGAVGSAAGRKLAEVSHSQHSLLSRQPLTVQARARAGQSANQHPYTKPQASFLHTQSNVLLHPHSRNQTGSAQALHRQEVGKSPFSLTFGRLYSLRGLKDKMNKLPAQSKRGTTSSPVQGRKSMS